MFRVNIIVSLWWWFVGYFSHCEIYCSNLPAFLFYMYEFTHTHWSVCWQRWVSLKKYMNAL